MTEHLHVPSRRSHQRFSEACTALRCICRLAPRAADSRRQSCGQPSPPLTQRPTTARTRPLHGPRVRLPLAKSTSGEHYLPKHCHRAAGTDETEGSSCSGTREWAPQAGFATFDAFNGSAARLPVRQSDYVSDNTAPECRGRGRDGEEGDHSPASGHGDGVASGAGPDV